MRIYILLQVVFSNKNETKWMEKEEKNGCCYWLRSLEISTITECSAYILRSNVMFEFCYLVQICGNRLDACNPCSFVHLTVGADYLEKYNNKKINPIHSPIGNG